MRSFSDLIPEWVFTFYEACIRFIRVKLRVTHVPSLRSFHLVEPSNIHPVRQFPQSFIHCERCRRSSFLPLPPLLSLVVILVRTLIRRRAEKERKRVILVGDAKSGKTSLMDMICASHNSTAVENDSVRMADVPVDINQDTALAVEHTIVVEYKQPVQETTHSKQLEEDLKTALCIVCLIDGASFNPVPTADFIHALLSDPVFLANPIPILLAVNKSDLRRCVHNDTAYQLVEQEVGRRTGIDDYSFKCYSPCTLYSYNVSLITESYKTITEFITACLQ